MYARELTKEYLQKVGITKITKDGKHIYFGKREAWRLIVAIFGISITSWDFNSLWFSFTVVIV